MLYVHAMDYRITYITTPIFPREVTDPVPVDGEKLGTGNGTVKALKMYLNATKKSSAKSRRKSGVLPPTDAFDAQVIRALQVYLNSGKMLSTTHKLTAASEARQPVYPTCICAHF